MSEFSDEYYQALEAAMLELIDMLAPHLAASRITMLRDDVGAGEYGLALETAVDFIRDEGREGEVDAGIRAKIHAIARTMDLQDDSRFKDLKDKGD